MRSGLTSRDEEPRRVQSDELSPVVDPLRSRDGGDGSLDVPEKSKSRWIRKRYDARES